MYLLYNTSTEAVKGGWSQVATICLSRDLRRAPSCVTRDSVAMASAMASTMASTMHVKHRRSGAESWNRATVDARTAQRITDACACAPPQHRPSPQHDGMWPPAAGVLWVPEFPRGPELFSGIAACGRVDAPCGRCLSRQGRAARTGCAWPSPVRVASRRRDMETLAHSYAPPAHAARDFRPFCTWLGFFQSPRPSAAVDACPQ